VEEAVLVAGVPEVGNPESSFFFRCHALPRDTSRFILIGIQRTQDGPRYRYIVREYVISVLSSFSL